MRIGLRGLVTGVLALAMLALGAGAAQAQAPVLENGKTKAVYDYTKAIRERVFIPQPGIDVDRNGKDDFITIDIIRPAESAATKKMPAIIDPSPYYVTSCRGNESWCMSDWDNDGVNDRWPLFYDNYFVPRGYAYILAQMNGTGYTEEGCPMHGGPTDIAGEKSVIDWLNGRVKGYKQADPAVAGDPTTPDMSKEAVADWHNGSSAMIGKSYDGTLANGVAATGVDGLKTIVPISAISAWYNYSRRGGIRQNTDYPGGNANGLNRTITYPGTPPNTAKGGLHAVNLPNRRGSSTNQTPCWLVNQEINNDANVDTGDGDAHGDINTFWRDRDYVKDADKVKASVFIAHGLQDDNVKMDHVQMWWDALKANPNNLDLKLWLVRAGHEDPFESRRLEWVDTLHRWFDHELYGVQNGIMDEPSVTVEEKADEWANYTDWPINGTQNVDVFLRAVGDPAAAGTLGGMAGGGAADTLGFTARTNTSETASGANAAFNLMNTPAGAQTYRRVFMSRALTKNVRLSGTAIADLAARLGCPAANPTCETTQSNLSVIVADYGAGKQVSRSDEGVEDLTTRSCWGVASDGVTCQNQALGAGCTAPVKEIDHACYLDIKKPIVDVTQWRVTRGVLDSANRNSLWFADPSVGPVSITGENRYKITTMANEHTFEAGHQIAVIVAGTNASDVSGTGNNEVPVFLNTRTSKVTLPIVGGYAQAASAGLTDAETVAPTLGDVPADILVGTTDASGTTVTYALPTATDNEDPNPVVTCDPASGSKFAVGTTTVSCFAKDANGNTSAPKTFKVVVRRDVPVDGTVGGSVPATLALTLGAPAAFAPFTPGIAKEYEAGTTANVISTAANAALTVSEPGHMTNGAFSLAEPLRVEFSKAAWSAPVSNDTVNVKFKQLIEANDPLRTGTYSKTLTFTLSTTQP